MGRISKLAVGVAVGVLAASFAVSLASSGPAAAVSPPTVDRASSTQQSGSLDRSFAGGTGYRAIPHPADATVSGRGLGVLVSQTGRIRTITVHEDTPGGGGLNRILLRSWTSKGWTDQSFASGRPRTIYRGDGGGGVTDAASTMADSVSMRGYCTGCAPTLMRFASNGSLAARTAITDVSAPQQVATRFQSSGGSTTCTTSAAGAVVTARDAGFSVRSSVDLLPWEDCRSLASAGDHVWVVSTFHSGGGTRLTASRRSASGALEPTWGTGGYVDVSWNFGRVQAVSGRADGSLYVFSTRFFAQAYRHIVTVTRFLPTGQPDPSFGTDGSVQVGLDGDVLAGRSVFLEAQDVGPHGPALALMVRDPIAGADSSIRYRIIRLALADGAIDQGFGSRGVVTQANSVTALTHDASGRILTVNQSTAGTLALVRRNA